MLDALRDLFILRGPPEYIRSNNGPEFIAQKVRDWIAAVGAKTAYIEPGSPWENGYCESFNARFRDELLNGELFYRLKEAQIPIEKWRIHYNIVRPHNSLGDRPHAPESIVRMDQRPTMHLHSNRITQWAHAKSLNLIGRYLQKRSFSQSVLNMESRKTFMNMSASLMQFSIRQIKRIKKSARVRMFEILFFSSRNIQNNLNSFQHLSEQPKIFILILEY